MESQLKAKIEASLSDIAERLETCIQMTLSDKRSTLVKISEALRDLENHISRLQLATGNRNPDLIESYEDQLTALTEKLNNMSAINPSGAPTPNPGQSPLEKAQAPKDLGPSQLKTQALAQQGQAKLQDGQSRALGLLKTVNSMREEVNLIDDEIMLQREKLLLVNQKLKETQSLLNQTKRLVAFFSKAVYDDVFIKAMIGLIAFVLVVILILTINIKIKKGNLEKQRKEKQAAVKKKQNYDEIDENLFQPENAQAAKDSAVDPLADQKQSVRSPKNNSEVVKI